MSAWRQQGPSWFQQGLDYHAREEEIGAVIRCSGHITSILAVPVKNFTARDVQLAPCIHEYVFTNTNAYTYLGGSVRVFYYGDTYRDTPSDCVRIFVAGVEAND